MNIPTDKWTIQAAAGICIIGNGPGEMPKFEHDRPFIRFNLREDTPLSLMEIRVSNQRVSQRSCESGLLQVLSWGMRDAERDRFQRLLTQQASKLDADLGCPPSTGLATVHACMELGLSPHVFRMPLRPSLLRASELAPRQPLAAAFHNWLGEQRMAWRLIAAQDEHLNWPDMTANSHAITSETEGHLDPYPCIFDWMKNAASRGPSAVDRASLVELATSSQFDWKGHANHERLRQLEPFFHLDRVRQETPNWWLYSNSLSTTIDTLLRRLTQAQQFLYL
ncbi:hypothetical protein [Pseudomonas sp.]|uniref:hypothetical protein n=1 Tax=Pseudomonas sp. TaxID=306 RepID=UPI00299EE9EC|nr:hypothetical protein [Pseudomonas sp.]MDX1366870.1 hypothetical protein [Pseudomonas sp.]